jgi:hypothetical protein
MLLHPFPGSARAAQRRACSFQRLAEKLLSCSTLEKASGDGAGGCTRGRPFDFAQGKQCAPRSSSRMQREAVAFRIDNNRAKTMRSDLVLFLQNFTAV